MNLREIKENAEKEIGAAQSENELVSIKLKYLGRKGSLTEVLRSLKSMSETERRKIGSEANALRASLQKLLTQAVSRMEKSPKHSAIDVTAPGKGLPRGHLHPLSIVREHVEKVFESIGFSVIEGPEVETEYYNFDALNIPANHPARDMWDTFWLRSNQDKQLTTDSKQNKSSRSEVRRQRLLMRTHTSPVQIRYMETHEPPLQIIVPGRVFRYEATDAGHEINFYQVEGLMVGKDVSLANFKYVIEHALRRILGPEVKMRLRPSYFPFVEPGLEVDVFYRGKWFEIMGAGMVHPRVFEYAHYNPNDWQGFAFGFGLDRIAMIKYNIPDIRLFYGGDLRFIEQF